MQQDPERTVADARARIEALRRSLAGGGAPPELIETHISWILLHGRTAWKFKKPVRLPFLDWRTLAARRRDAEEELRLNARLAPQLYRDCVDVHDGPGGPTLGGSGPVVDVALRMRRFADGALWRERIVAGRLQPAEVDRLAERLARFHAQAAVAAPASGYGSAAVQRHVVADLAEALDAWCATPSGRAQAGAWQALRGWLGTELERLAPLWAERLAGGRVREGHGDLHLANLLTLDDGEATAFDALEFDPALRWIDVLHDLAFALMDLIAHGAPALAWRLLDGYLAHGGDHAGLPALRFWLVCRALVRARVAMLGPLPRGTPDAAGYLALACALAQPAAARLAITAGLPGSGKSHVALQLLQAAGAIRIRSDVERKRLHGLAPLQASDGTIYDRASTARTYARLLQLARAALAAGWPVIVDAAFLQAGERAAFAALAAQQRVPFAVLWCEAPADLLRTRVTARMQRRDDPSEADAAVLERLLPHAPRPATAEQPHLLRIDTAQPLAADALDARWRAASCPSAE
ncbi:AAA family ATPase [Pseudorhodoferax sp.]|uniref:bifunctional aminoglycoside phosphotransferase/ATP-binding protein n=1 Tax=Pseudorhodoferax sp. TaxID=1993553 RepID=UPI0039E3704C